MFINGLIRVKHVEHQNRAISMAKNGNQQQIRALINMANVLAALISRVNVNRRQAMPPWTSETGSGSVLQFVDFQCSRETENT